MRPRVFPAEDPVKSASYAGAVAASMRPRVFPAEDRGVESGHASRRPCFNEAAGIPRGRLQSPHSWHRPSSRFNEAAGIPRGRHGALPTDHSGISLLQ